MSCRNLIVIRFANSQSNFMKQQQESVLQSFNEKTDLKLLGYQPST